MNSVTEVIAAVSTPPGKGGVAVIRMSGDGAFDIARQVFSPAFSTFDKIQPRKQTYGYIIDNEEKIDDVLISLFPSPNSYTGEDTVEISCHGGMLVTRTVLEALFKAGARPAEAGEFTKRAFISGKLSLTDAEAIGNLLEAKSREQIRLNSSTQRDKLAAKIAEIRGELLDLMSSMYARIDYPDEDLGDFDDAEVYRRLNDIKETISRLLSTYKTGRAITEGISTVICGKPNVGKSSLYNLLIGEDAAIVTECAGTTRDVLTRTASLGKVMLRLADTAGIRENEGVDTVERIGIERSREMIEKSELLFAIFDLSRPFDEEDAEIISTISNTSAVKIAVLNKSDMPTLFDKERLGGGFDEIITLSTVSNEAGAIDSLTKIVDALFTDEKISTKDDAIISSARQHAALMRALDFVNLAIESLGAGFMQDAVSGDIERALGAIAELDGRATGEEIVKDIFSKFCVGK